MALLDLEPYDADEERRRLAAAPAPGPFGETTPNRGSGEPTSGTPGTHVGPFTDPAAPPSGSRFSADQWEGYRKEAADAGISSAWFDDFIARNPDDPNRATEAYRNWTDHRPYDSQSGNPNEQAQNRTADARYGAAPGRGVFLPGATGGGGGGGVMPQGPAGINSGPFSSPPFGASTTYAGGAFDDPATNFAEQFALERFGQRTNPPEGSGTAMYESFAKEFASLLKADPFTDTEEAAMRVQAFDQLEQDKQAELRQKSQELASRGMTEGSGVYISEMNRIRDKWDKHKATTENTLLTTAIGERQRRLTQSFSVLASLAASENGRMDAALALALMPLQLQDQAFNRLVTATNLGGNSSQITNSLMQLLTVATDNQRYNDQDRAAAMAAIGEYLGGLLG